MSQETRPKGQGNFNHRLCGGLFVVSVVTVVILITYIRYYGTNNTELIIPVGFTGKTGNVTYEKDQILYFDQFEDFGIGNFVEQCENGTISTIIIDGVYFDASQYFFTFVAEIDTKETQRSSNIYAYHQFGKFGKVEFFKLPNLQGDGWLQQISHSWMWTISPDRHRDQMWFQVDSNTNFLNYTLTVFNLNLNKVLIYLG